jgi:hypothetical protein
MVGSFRAVVIGFDGEEDGQPLKDGMLGSLSTTSLILTMTMAKQSLQTNSTVCSSNGCFFILNYPIHPPMAYSVAIIPSAAIRSRSRPGRVT